MCRYIIRTHTCSLQHQACGVVLRVIVVADILGDIRALPGHVLSLVTVLVLEMLMLVLVLLKDVKVRLIKTGAFELYLLWVQLGIGIILLKLLLCLVHVDPDFDRGKVERLVSRAASATLV